MKTANLDRLAKDGMRFDQAYICQPVCGPARAAIFTRTYPHSNGSWGNTMALNQDSRTVGQRMQKNGFHTAYVGKWHLEGWDYFGYSQCPDGLVIYTSDHVEGLGDHCITNKGAAMYDEITKYS